MIDALRGTLLVIFIASLAGTIAYVGDRVGHQVGRRRMTLFNIRPRYTSTIVAIGTGVIIALVVTIGAILASAQVKTAFFRMDAINRQISLLTDREKQLEAKVENGRLVVGIDTLMSPFPAILAKNASIATTNDVLAKFYRDTVTYLDETYTQLGLKPYAMPPDAYATLQSLSKNVRLRGYLAKANVLLLATSRHNLYEGDRIRFNLTTVPDVMIYRRGTFLNAIGIPSNPNVNITLAVEQLEAQIARQAADPKNTPDHSLPLPVNGYPMPIYFAGKVRPVDYVPSLDKMQQLVSAGKHNYELAAFAADDVYPHSGGIPVVVTLQRGPNLR